MNYLLSILVLFPFLAGVICRAVGTKDEKIRDYVAIGSAVIEFAMLLGIGYLHLFGEAGESFLLGDIPDICALGLQFQMDGFTLVYTLIAGFMWMMAIMLSPEYFSHHHNRNRYYFYMLWTLGATVGVFLSASLYTTFIFFEIMSFTSYVWVAQEENAPSLRAADTYLSIAIIGGLVMLMGLFMTYHELGTLMISEILDAVEAHGLTPSIYAAGFCMFFGFGVKAGAFPVHIWLPKAHPVAPAPASALLSGILTKTGIFGILIVTSRLFLHNAAWGSMVLIVGEITMFVGALLAVFSIDLKRTLACSSLSQIGFILIGIGMQGLLGEENILAVHGTMLHMINHSLIKLVLFMAAGVVYMNTHSLDLNEIRGFGRKKPLLMAIFLVGALTIAGIPGFGGYVSKTLLHESIVEYGGGPVMKAAEWVFLVSGGMTLAYMTKLFVAIFVENNVDAKVQNKYDNMSHYMNGLTTFALAGSALVLLLWGLVPHKFMEHIAELGQTFMMCHEESHAVAFYEWKNLSGGLISIAIGILIYLFVIRGQLLRRNYINAWPKWMDLEELIYRPVLIRMMPFVFGILCRIPDSIIDAIVILIRRTILKDSPLPREREEGTVISTLIGRIRNIWQTFANHTYHRKKKTYFDYVHMEAIKSEERNEEYNIIQRSLSFGLTLFGVGLMLTLIYLMYM